MRLGSFIKLKWQSFWKSFLTPEKSTISVGFTNVKCGRMRTDVNVDGGHLKISGLVIFISGELDRNDQFLTQTFTPSWSSFALDPITGLY